MFVGDFFDVLSPAGPMSSEPIIAQFFDTTTETSYSEVPGVHGVVRHVKSVARLLLSVALVGALFLDAPASRFVLVMLTGTVAVLVVVGAALVWARGTLSMVVVATLTPVVRVVTGVTRRTPLGRDAVTGVVERFWEHVIQFRDMPELLGVIVFSGVFEQLPTSLAPRVTPVGTDTTVAFIPIVAVILLPRATNVVPVPGGLGAYDVFLVGALSLMTDVPAAGATATMLIVRTFELLVPLGCGGVATELLHGVQA